MDREFDRSSIQPESWQAIRFFFFLIFFLSFLEIYIFR